jgi:hypothetical protein
VAIYCCDGGIPITEVAGARRRRVSAGDCEEYLYRGEDRGGKKDYNGAITDYNMALRLKPVVTRLGFPMNARGISYM